jgi:predicted transcriptional regulator
MKERVAEIVAAYVRRNRIDPAALGELIASVSKSLAGLGGPEPAPPAPPLTPAVPIRRSVTADKVTCVECGWSSQMLKRHLGSAHGLTVNEYRTRWNLRRDYPMVAKNYSARRSQLAKALGLGRQERPRTTTAT